VRPSRFIASTGVRLAVVQTVLLVVAFAIAGWLTTFTVTYLYRLDVKARILGQAATMAATFQARHAIGEVAAAVTRSEYRPGGLEYRLEGPDRRYLAGDLPPTGAQLGWTYLDWDDAVVPGRPYQDLLVYTAQLPDRSVLTVGQDLSDESKLRHALKGTLFWCGAAGAAIGLCLSYLLTRGALRRVDGVVAAARAVSAGRMEVRAPRRRALIPDDIDELGASFNAMLDEIATLVERLRWVSTDIAHDLRTPLTHARQKLERIEAAAGGNRDVVEAAREVEGDIEALLRVFDAMLRLAEIESGRAARFERIDLGELAGRIADAYRPDIEASGRRLEVALTDAPISAEPDLIAHAIANLLENALRHTPVGACVSLKVETRGGFAEVSVRDDGPGIPAERREQVLQRFYRLEASRTTPGSGLGLAIVSAVAGRHDARLTLSDADPGLAVRLSFPRLSGRADEVSRAPALSAV
jgi:signal transduction histidine kinase